MKKLKVLIIFILFTNILVSCNGIEKEDINSENIVLLTILDKDKNSLQNNSVLGDGETIIILRAKIPENTDKKNKTITFSKSAGSFQEVSNTEGKIVANSEGIAEIKLKVPLDNTEIFVSAQVSNGDEIFTDEKKVNLEDVGDVIDLNFKDIQNNDLANITLRADGTSIIKLEGNILFNKKGFTSIIFETTDGLFQSNNAKTETKNTDINGKATVNYIVPRTPGTFFYNAKADKDGKYIDTKELIFQRAHADKIVIEPTLILMDTINSNSIKVFLSREIGKVSTGTDVKFKSYQMINGAEKEVGRFIGENEAKSDLNGLVNIQFKADTQDFDKELPIFIRASTEKDDLSTFTEEIELKIKK